MMEEGKMQEIGSLINQLVTGTMGKVADERPRNALRRDGSSQQRRLPLALADGYFQIDAHGTGDLLDFAHRLASEVRFMDTDPQSKKNWQVFFAQDPSMVLVSVQKYRLSQWQDYVHGAIAAMRKLLDGIRSAPDSPTPEEAIRVAKEIAKVIAACHQGDVDQAGPARSMVEWQARLGDEPLFQPDFTNAVQGLVRRQVHDLIRVHFEMSKSAAFALHVPWNGDTYLLPGDPWGWEGMRARAPYLPGSPTQEPIHYKGTGLAGKLDNVLAALSRIATAIGQACAGLQARAKAQFARSLESHGAHRPHMGLFLAFLQLYRHAQGRLNEVGPAHLDYYYREVLRLAPQPAQPDHVHLVGHLSGGIAKVQLPARTQFVAKDHRVYATTEAWTLNSAQIGLMLGVQRQGSLVALAQGESPAASGTWPAHKGMQAITAAKVGWAVASPVLRMQAGNRRIKLGMALGSGAHGLGTERKAEIVSQFRQLPPLKVQITTAKGWEALVLEEAPRWLAATEDPANDAWMPATFAQRDVLVFALKADVEVPAIVGYLPSLHGEGWESRDPILQLSMESGVEGYSLYSMLSAAEVQAWSLSVGVSNAKPAMENDEGAIDGTKPFAPFGQQPALKSRWVIDIHEAMSKNPQEITLNWFWGNLTAHEIPQYFSAYSQYMIETGQWDSPISEADFVAKVEMYQRGTLVKDYALQPLHEAPHSRKRKLRFAGHGDGDYKKLPAHASLEQWEKPAKSGVRDGHYLQLSFYSNALFDLDRGYPNARPSIAYGHQHHALVLAHQMQQLQQAQLSALAKPGQAPPPLPDLSVQPPLRPTIAEARLWYLASDGWEGNAVDKAGSGQFYHIDPHGQVRRQRSTSGLPLLPRFEEGAVLYLGIQHLEAPAQLSLLFHLLPGSGNPDLPMPAIQWTYLGGNQWCPFLPSEMPSDETRGLRQSGIVRLNIPQAVHRPQTAMPAGFVWLRLQATGTAAALDQIVQIHAQGLVATLQPETGPETPLPLAPRSISKPTSYVAGLKEVQQPYSSFGGASAATPTQFRASVAERLRHKNRSIAILDYEKMVLEHFPDVYKVRCLNHTAPMGTMVSGKVLPYDHELSPGHLTVACIPKTPALNSLNPLQPKFGRDLLGEIQTCLQASVPPFVTVHVTNPLYQVVKVHGQVAFKPQADAGLALDRLHDVIARYLCPWAFDAQEEIHFGGQVHRSQLLRLLEQQAEVDVVAQFQITVDGEPVNEADWIATAASRAVLVAATTHGLVPTALERLEYAGSEIYGGIDFWRVQEDFIVNGN